MTRRAAPLAALFLAATTSVLACPAHFHSSPLTVVDRNGGNLAVGDLLDWTLAVRNGGCGSGTPVYLFVPIELTQTFVSVGQGGIWDAPTRQIHWDSGTTPALANMPAKSEFVVTFTTQIASVPSPVVWCARAWLAASYNEICDPSTNACYSDDPATSVLDDPTCLPLSPLLTWIAPCGGTALGGTVLTVTGEHFDAAAKVLIGGAEALVTARSEGSISAMSPAGTAGSFADVVVRNPAGRDSGLVSAWAFAHDPPSGRCCCARSPTRRTPTS